MKKDVKIIVSLLVIAVLVVAVAFYVSTSLPPKTTDVSHTSGLSMASTNYAAMVIQYANGQSATITSTQSSASKSLSLINESPTAGTVGATATSINTNLDMIPVYTGTVSSYTIAPGAFQVLVVVGTVTTSAGANSGTIIYNSGQVALSPISPQPSMPASGGSVIVCSSTVNGNSPPFTGVNYVQGTTYTLCDEISSFTISGTFNDGTTFGPVTAGVAWCFWTFQYSSSDTFTSISVNFALSTH